jgi:hypothetical protein
MDGDDKDGSYCLVCGGIPQNKIRTKRILIAGMETGIDHLDFIFYDVRTLNLGKGAALGKEIAERGQGVQFPRRRSPCMRRLQYGNTAGRSSSDV